MNTQTQGMGMGGMRGRAGAEQGGGSKATSEYLTFRLGAEEYGIDILRVQEIRSYEEPTRIANSPNFIKGVVNLRGVIVPVVDLRIKLGCESVEYNGFTVVIVLNVAGRVVGAHVTDAIGAGSTGRTACDVLVVGGDPGRRGVPGSGDQPGPDAADAAAPCRLCACLYIRVSDLLIGPTT